MKTDRWFVFMYGEELSETLSRHPSYRQAVLEAQGRGCSEHTPRRVTAGCYILHGCSGLTAYIIASRKGMLKHGYGDPNAVEAA